MSHDALKQVGAGDGFLPPEDDLTRPWWDATRDRRLLLQLCTTCGARQHHPRYVCVTCGATTGLDWVESRGGGVVDTFTVVHRAPRPDLVAPYVIARVRLDDGPVLLARLVDVEATDDAVVIGARLVLAWSPLADGRAMPVFAPEGSS